MLRRSLSDTRGVICVTLIIRLARGRGEPAQQIDQPTEVVVPEMRPARSDHHGWIVGDEIGPLSREPGELSGVILKIDAVLPPRLTTLD
jgi:hypothetical protein